MTLTLPTSDAGNTRRQRFDLELLLQQPVPDQSNCWQAASCSATPSRTSARINGGYCRPCRSPSVQTTWTSRSPASGEETGEMDKMLSKVADFYEDEVSAMVKALTSMLEPAMIVVVGGIVGSILLAMYLPMFTVFDQIQ